MQTHFNPSRSSLFTNNSVHKRLMMADRAGHQPQSKSATAPPLRHKVGAAAWMQSASLYLCQREQLANMGRVVHVARVHAKGMHMQTHFNPSRSSLFTNNSVHKRLMMADRAGHQPQSKSAIAPPLRHRVGAAAWMQSASLTQLANMSRVAQLDQVHAKECTGQLISTHPDPACSQTTLFTNGS